MFDGVLFQSAIKVKASAGNLSVPEAAKSKLHKTSSFTKCWKTNSMVTKLVFPKMFLLNDYPARIQDLIKRLKS